MVCANGKRQVESLWCIERKVKRLELFKGYVKTKNKECIEKFKDVPSSGLHTIDEAKNLPEYAGILADDVILIDIDDEQQGEVMMNIVEEYQLDCRVYQTTRGRHFVFKNNGVDKCGTHVKLAIGLTADIKVGHKNSYEILKINGEERFIEWDIEDGHDYQEVPKWLHPVRSTMEFLDMTSGSGRNSALYGYILTLQSAGFEKEEARQAIRILNKFVLEEPLEDDELEVILRDEAFQKEIFFVKRTFQHDKFGNFFKSQFHVKRINGLLHMYRDIDGIYVSGAKMFENAMVSIIPNLKSTQRTEAMKYIDITTPDEAFENDSGLIAFRNGVYDIYSDVLLPFSPEYIITSKIPWDYNPTAYSELCDKTFNKLSCNDKDIRLLLEECIGYCFLNRNEMSKSFILIGSGANGKSTYLDALKNVLGRKNYVSLDMDELSDRFSPSTMFGKLANIGDDISDEFLQGKAISQFKKIVSGNDIKGEDKGQDIYFFRPKVKLLFSANEIPRMRNKGFDAIKRRLIIIPFNAKFSKDDPDYQWNIVSELKKQDVAEYMIRMGLKGLKRVLMNQGFTESDKIQKELESFELDNNPIKLFLDEVDEQEVLNQSTASVFRRYSVFCDENHFTSTTSRKFATEIKKTLGCEVKQITLNVGGKSSRQYCYVR